MIKFYIKKYIFKNKHLNKLFIAEKELTTYEYGEGLSTGSSISRLTYENRFKKYDNLIAKFLRENLKFKYKKFNYLELGASNGITTIDLFKFLDLNKYTIYLSDTYSIVYEFKINNFISIFTDSSKKIFLVKFFFIAGINRFKFIFSKILFLLILKFYSKKINYNGGIEHNLYIEKIKNEINIYNIIRDDLFNNLSNYYEKFEIIRCFNILNANKFNQSELTNKLSIIKKYLKENGILIIGRSNNTQLNASFFVKKLNKLLLLKDLENGSELKNLILSI